MGYPKLLLLNIPRYLKEPLIKNSIFLMFTSISSAGSGFIFWIFAARYYSPIEVGIASALVSSMGVIITLSLLGFDISLVKYLLKEKNQSDILTTCLITSVTFSLFLSLIFTLGIDIWPPSVQFINPSFFVASLFALFTAFGVVQSLQQQGVFLGFRKTEYSAIQTIVTLTRIVVIPILVPFGAIGVFIAYGITPILSVFLGFYFINRIIQYQPKFSLNTNTLKQVFGYSINNYFARVFEQLPNFLLPLLVTAVLGAEENAYFFIAWQIAYMTLMIPRWTSVSLFAEGTVSERSLYGNFKKAFLLILILLCVVIISIIIFGKFVLFMFGSSYVEHSYQILLILLIASVPFSINALYGTLKRLQNNTGTVIVLYGSILLITMVLGLISISAYGVAGVAWAWVVTNSLVSIGVILRMIYERKSI